MSHELSSKKQFDALETARLRSGIDYDREARAEEIYDNFVGNSIEANADMVEYLESRPTNHSETIEGITEAQLSNFRTEQGNDLPSFTALALEIKAARMRQDRTAALDREEELVMALEERARLSGWTDAELHTAKERYMAIAEENTASPRDDSGYDADGEAAEALTRIRAHGKKLEEESNDAMEREYPLIEKIPIDEDEDDESGLAPERYKIEKIPIDDEDDLEEELTREQLIARLDTAREKWAEISTKRHGRLFDRRIKGYNATAQEYQEALRATGREECAEALAKDGLTQSEKNAIAIGYLVQEQNKLRDMTTEKINNTKVGKFVKWMNTGTKWQRAGKGILIGAGAGVVGGFLGPAGIVGAGALVAGASRFVRGYAAHDQRGVGSLNEATVKDNIEYRARMHQDSFDFDTVADVVDSKFEADSKNEQFKRRKAVAWGVGSVAIGATVGGLLHFGYDHLMSSSDVGDTPHPAAAPTESGVDQKGGEFGAEHSDKNPDVNTNTLGVEPNVTSSPVEYRFGYSTAPEHIVTQAARDMGIDIGTSGNKSTLAINEMYEKFGAKGVFNGAELYEISKDNVGIAEAGGTASLKSEAAQYLREWYASHR